jgi:hypothetical protein
MGFTGSVKGGFGQHMLTLTLSELTVFSKVFAQEHYAFTEFEVDVSRSRWSRRYYGQLPIRL